MSDQQIEKSLDTEIRRQNIISITPEGWDPVVYWHTVAQDAMRSRDKTEKRRADMLSDYTFPSVRELLNRVQDGDFSMNIQFSFYPNTTKGE